MGFYTVDLQNKSDQHETRVVESNQELICETLRLLEAVDELEALVNNRRAKESDFQDFFERNQSFILDDEYKRAHSHLVLARDDRGPLVPGC